MEWIHPDKTNTMISFKLMNAMFLDVLQYIHVSVFLTEKEITKNDADFIVFT